MEQPDLFDPVLINLLKLAGPKSFRTFRFYRWWSLTNHHGGPRWKLRFLEERKIWQWCWKDNLPNDTPFHGPVPGCRNGNGGFPVNLLKPVNAALTGYPHHYGGSETHCRKCFSEYRLFFLWFHQKPECWKPYLNCFHWNGWGRKPVYPKYWRKPRSVGVPLFGWPGNKSSGSWLKAEYSSWDWSFS